MPLFVEELTKTILESGILKENGDRLVLSGPLSTIAIPTTLHDSLMARLDRLQPIKVVAQTAACIGRAFSHRMLAQILPLSDAELGSALDGLIRAELIYRRGLPPEATYLFKHALVRDAAYESLLKEPRRAVHARILTALESAADAEPEILAFHAEAANLTGRAIALWEAAGKAAIARPAFSEGISNLRRAISLLSPQINGGENAVAEQALNLQIQLGLACMQGIGYGSDETKEALERALVLAEKAGNKQLRLVALYALWTGMFVRAEHAEALLRAQELQGLGEKAGNTELAGVANRLIGIGQIATGRFAEAEQYIDQSLALLDPVENKSSAGRMGQDVATATHSYACLKAALLGRTRKSRHHALEAEKAALASDHLPSICYMHAHLILAAVTCGDETALERHAHALKPIAEEHKLAVWGCCADIGEAFLIAATGDVSAIDRYLQVDAKLIAINFRCYMPMLRISAGRRALVLGLRDHAVRLVAMADEMMQATGETFALSDLHRLKAVIARSDDDNETAESLLNTALDIARKQGAILYGLRAAIDLARVLKDLGRSDEAISLLNPIHSCIAEGDCPKVQKTARELLAELAA